MKDSLLNISQGLSKAERNYEQLDKLFDTICQLRNSGSQEDILFLERMTGLPIDDLVSLLHQATSVYGKTVFALKDKMSKEAIDIPDTMFALY